MLPATAAGVPVASRARLSRACRGGSKLSRPVLRVSIGAAIAASLAGPYSDALLRESSESMPASLSLPSAALVSSVAVNGRVAVSAARLRLDVVLTRLTSRTGRWDSELGRRRRAVRCPLLARGVGVGNKNL